MQAPVFRILILMLLLSTVSCAQMQTGGASDNEPGAVPATTAEESDFYYDFDDILVPKEMELQTKDSFILETPSMKSGVMVFEGKVEVVSLTNFFINNMMKDNWQMRSAFKSNRTILVFEKMNRYCIMNITDDKFTTLLEIWVSPRSSDGAQVITPNSTY